MLVKNTPNCGGNDRTKRPYFHNSPRIGGCLNEKCKIFGRKGSKPKLGRVMSNSG